MSCRKGCRNEKGYKSISEKIELDTLGFLLQLCNTTLLPAAGRGQQVGDVLSGMIVSSTYDVIK